MKPPLAGSGNGFQSVHFVPRWFAIDGDHPPTKPRSQRLNCALTGRASIPYLVLTLMPLRPHALPAGFISPCLPSDIVFCPSVVDERRSRVGHLPGALRHFAHDRI